jgi:acyl-coenzyme A thioesterase PaaI-like protein
MEPHAIQDFYPDDLAHCYGCGRLNPHGLHVRSTWDGDETVAVLTPRPEHTAIPGYVYGGLIASLIDCHGTGSAALAAYRAAGRDPAAEFAAAGGHPAAKSATARGDAGVERPSTGAASDRPAGNASPTATERVPAPPPLRFVTAALQVDYLRPTPLGVPLTARGRIIELKPRKVVVEIRIEAVGQISAQGSVVAVLMPESMLA